MMIPLGCWRSTVPFGDARNSWLSEFIEQVIVLCEYEFGPQLWSTIAPSSIQWGVLFDPPCLVCSGLFTLLSRCSSWGIRGRMLQRQVRAEDGGMGEGAEIAAGPKQYREGARLDDWLLPRSEPPSL
eukprot:5320671-Amphidinium_carterae.1